MREESRWLHELVERLRSMQPSAEDTERLHDRIAQWGRESKQLALKAGEYGERLSGLDRWVAPSPSVEEVCLQQKRVERRRNEVTKLRTRLTGYHGLPSDVDVARDEVRRAQIELDGLKNQKVELFSQLLQDRDESETE